MNDTPFRATAQELENCAKEPIHLTPLVQSYGFMLACDRDSAQIEFASTNVEKHLGIEAANILGTPLSQYVTTPPEKLKLLLQGIPEGSPVLLDLPLHTPHAAADNFEVLGHRIGQRVVIEAMPTAVVAGSNEYLRQLESLVANIGALNQNTELDEYLDQCTGQIRELSGYQRVIIYRFLPDWSGEVLAESVAAGVDTRFLGLRFPASDIPVQARALYRKNLIRIIGDVIAEPAPVLALTPGQVLDQSHSLLRSPSPMHLGYLRNMGTRSTMTISLLKDGELWGMVSCHHDQPRTLPLQLRRGAMVLSALVAEAASARIDTMVRKAAAENRLKLREALVGFSFALRGAAAFGGLLDTAMAQIRGVLQVQDYAIVLDGSLVSGAPISPRLLDYLERKTVEVADQGYFATHHITADPLCPIDNTADWAGYALAPIPGRARSFVVLLRHEVIRQVRWAGAPSTSTEVLASGLRVLGPRESFTEWVQEVSGQCEDWGENEKFACMEIAKNIAEQYILHLNQQLSSELHMLGSCMSRLNDMVVVTDTVAVDAPGPRIVYVNDAFVAETGYSREEAVGHSPRFLQGPLTDRAVLQRIRDAMVQWKPVTAELVNYRKDGSSFWVELAIAPVADETGWYTHFVAIERNITERKLTQHSLQQSLHEREALLKEVHHRVKNNLQVIISLLRLETYRNDVPQAVNVLKDMQGRIHSMALLHESLYRSGTLASIDLGHYLGQIARQVFQTQAVNSNGVQLRLDMDALTVGMDQAIACGLLINELVSNCAKHAFPSDAAALPAGEVFVELHPENPDTVRTDAMWCLKVRDTGVGLPPNFDVKRLDSLGLQLVSDLSRQVGGALTILSQPGAGAEFSVRFKAIAPAALMMPG